MRKIIKLKIILIFTILGILSKTYAQDDYQIHLKDYHSAQITDIITSKDEKRIFTIDESGKILSYFTEDFSYEKTIRKSDGFFLENPKLVINGMGIAFKKNDTMFIIDVNSDKVLLKKQYKFKFVSHNNNFIVSANQINLLKSEIAVLDNSFQPINIFKTENKVITANVSKDTTLVAYVEEHYEQGQKIICRDLKSREILWETEGQKKSKIVHVFFSGIKNTFYAILLSDEQNLLSIYSYTNGIRNKEAALEIDWYSIHHSTSIKDYFLENNSILVTSKSNFPTNPIIINYANNKFTASKLELKQGAYSGTFLKNGSVVTSNVFNNFTAIANFTISDIKNRNAISTHPNFTQKFYEGMFLPDDSFLVEGIETKEKNNYKTDELQIKYFSKGTFYNRFNTLSFKDYLEINHKVDFYSKDYLFDKKSGFIIFNGKDLITDEYHIFKYNFIDDIVTKLYKIKDNFFNVVDYDATSNKLLLSPKRYYNRGYTEPQPLIIVENNESKKFDGLYKFAKFSDAAKHIATINDKNFVQIRTDFETVVFEEELVNGSYLLHKADNGFVVSNSFQEIDFGKCNKESIFFIPQENNIFKSDKKPCLYLNDLIYQKEKVAMFMENAGIFIIDKILPQSFLTNVKSISFNNDASKLMVSYANGKISVLDTKTQKEIGGMFHPSEKEHIFYDTSNHYFSNTNADDFLYVTKDNNKKSLQNADEIIFKPQEVLKVFGTPNQEYLTLLEKAISLRTNKKEFGEIQGSKNITINKKNTQKGDLYVLSIGVSKYKQEAYNLTFADKDAFDIANVYGKLDSITIKDFQDDFLGVNYQLKSSNNKKLASLKRYSGSYTSVGDFYPIDIDGEIWLEINYEKAFIWNYNTNTINEITFPDDFKKDRFSFKKQIYSARTDQEFYIRTNENVFYKFDFLSKKFIKIKIPFTIDYEQEADNLQPLLNNKWLHFNAISDGLKNEIKIVIGNVLSKEITTKTFDINTYKQFGKEEILEGSIYNPQFKDVNKSGTFLLYRGGNDETFVINLEKETTPIKIPINIDYGDDASISEDGNKITVLSSKLNEFRHKIITYNLKGEILDSKTFVDEDYTIKGMSIANANPKWIQSSSALVSDFNYSIFSSDKILSKSTPFSFHKTYVKKITNIDATKENIETEIANFLKDTKEQDQVILFIAGHGVLDKDNNYYYAPYNMDFSDVTKNGVAFNTIVKGLSNSKAAQKLLLMDTCHAGNTLDIDENSEKTTTVSEEGKRGTVTKSNKKAPKFKVSDIVSSLFDDFLSKSGITILSASSGEDVAYENKELSNGAFTSAYLKILKSKMGSYGVTEDGIKKTIPLTEDFIAEVLKEVMLLTNGKQVPDIREINKNVVIKAW
tara:strand:- start:1406 stop:5497 length:4092 start_codon:yes stop_codon:yes gene_type:complete